MNANHGPFYEVSRALVEETLRTAIALEGVFCALAENLPDDALPGEDPGEVLLEMLAGTCQPAIEAAGLRSAEVATQLVAALRDRVSADLMALARLVEIDPG